MPLAANEVYVDLPDTFEEGVLSRRVLIYDSRTDGGANLPRSVVYYFNIRVYTAHGGKRLFQMSVVPPISAIEFLLPPSLPVSHSPQVFSQGRRGVYRYTASPPDAVTIDSTRLFVQFLRAGTITATIMADDSYQGTPPVLLTNTVRVFGGRFGVSVGAQLATLSAAAAANDNAFTLRLTADSEAPLTQAPLILPADRWQSDMLGDITLLDNGKYARDFALGLLADGVVDSSSLTATVMMDGFAADYQPTLRLFTLFVRIPDTLRAIIAPPLQDNIVGEPRSTIFVNGGFGEVKSVSIHHRRSKPSADNAGRARICDFVKQCYIAQHIALPSVRDGNIKGAWSKAPRIPINTASRAIVYCFCPRR